MTLPVVTSIAVEADAELLFAGDMHLRTADEPNAAALLELLSHHGRANRYLILLGDVFYFYFENRKVPIKEFHWLIGALESNAASWGAIVLLRGNRDFLLGSTGTFPRCLHSGGDCLVIERGKSRILATHGDTFLRGDWSYVVFRKLIRSGMVRWAAKNIWPPLGVKIVGALRWITFRRRQGKAKPPNFEEILSASAEHKADTVVFGHFHRQISPDEFPWKVPSAFCIGSWENGSAPVLVMTADSARTVEVRNLDEKG
ncbi:MAG: metallophosphoesterase [Candidatus Brocadiia bacterium]